MKTAIVHGPAGCGKTTNAEALMRAFGCTDVVDPWHPNQAIQDGALHLTNHGDVLPTGIPSGVKVLPYDHAIREVFA